MDLSLKPKRIGSDNKGEFLVELELENVYDQDICITRDLLLLDGFTGDKFNIGRHSADGVMEVPYAGKSIKYNPEKQVIKAHEKISNMLNLAESYDFGDMSEGDEYVVTYNSPGFWYVDGCNKLVAGEDIEARVV